MNMTMTLNIDDEPSAPLRARASGVHNGFSGPIETDGGQRVDDTVLGNDAVVSIGGVVIAVAIGPALDFA